MSDTYISRFETGVEIDEILEAADEHIGDKSNPHEVTAEDVGLDLVDNTPDADKPISTLTLAALESLAGKAAITISTTPPTAGFWIEEVIE